jgi:hypothetical protein
MSLVDHYLPYFRQLLIIHPLLVLLPFHPPFTESSCGDQLLAPFPFSRVPPTFLPPLLCASFQFIIYSVFLFFAGGSVCAGDYAGLSWRWLGEYHMMLGAHLFGMPNVSQAGLEPVSGVSGSPPVFSA